MASINASSGANMNEYYPLMSGLRRLEGLENRWTNAWHPLWGILDCREVQSEKIMFQKETFDVCYLNIWLLNKVVQSKMK